MTKSKPNDSKKTVMPLNKLTTKKVTRSDKPIKLGGVPNQGKAAK